MYSFFIIIIKKKLHLNCRFTKIKIMEERMFGINVCTLNDISSLVSPVKLFVPVNYGDGEAVTSRNATQPDPRMQTKPNDDTPFFHTPPLGHHFGSQGTR